MGLLSKLKSLLGMEEDRQSPGSGVDVTVEREPSTESESAVKEPADSDEASTTDSDEASLAGDVDEPVAADADAAASTESLVDEDHTEDPTRAAEPAEAATTSGDSDDESPVAEDESDEAAADEGGEADGEQDVEKGGESVSVVKGIGPAYAERLEDVGVATVADLAAADPEDLADRTDLSAKRVGRWVELAQGRE